MASTPLSGWDFGSTVTGSGSLTGNPATADHTTNPTHSGQGGLRGRRAFHGPSSTRGPGRGRGRGGQVIVSSPSTPTPIPQASDTEGKQAESQAAPAVTRDCSTSSKVKFPLLSRYHGKELVTVRVGDDKNQVDFMVHKSLLCAASSYFSAALEGQFAESTMKTLTLKQHNPQAFEVLYQYIYTGVVHNATFYSPTYEVVGQDVLWLRVFRLADATMFEDLARVAYDRLRGLFTAVMPRIPSHTFITEMFGGEYPQTSLQEYVVAHSAFWINKGDIRASGPWVALVEKCTAFGVNIAVQLMKLSSISYSGSRVHPSEDISFDPETLFPILDLKGEPEDSEVCLFEGDCRFTRRMSADTKASNDWETEDLGVLQLLKKRRQEKCKVEVCSGPEMTLITELEVISKVVHSFALRGTPGMIKGSFCNVKEGRLEKWTIYVENMDVAVELADLMNRFRNK